MFLLIDNYDSFVYNLKHFIGELGADVIVKRNDEITVEEVVNGGYEGVILSPGPCTPDEAGICLEVVRQAPDDLPTQQVKDLGGSCGYADLDILFR